MNALTRRPLLTAAGALTAAIVGTVVVETVVRPTDPPDPGPLYCLTATPVQVDCHDPAARWAVLGAVGHVTLTGVEADWRAVCADYPRATSYTWRPYSWAELAEAPNGTGEALCVTEVAQ